MSFSTIANIAGGVGLFLLGMFMSTEGLRMLAGDSLRSLLARFTGGPLRSISLGTLVTVLVQSSHVTIIATISFVSAGLITFERSLGVVLGAHLGTTSIGWIVSLLGFKLQIGVIALSAALISVVLKLFFRGKISKVGAILTGFCLIFIGISFLQYGMKDLGSVINISHHIDDTILTRLQLVAIGLAMTIVTQSSGAALVLTLAALSLGQINVYQGAAMVIGQNIGTTLTAAIAAVNTSQPAKRTAAAHILFNVMTGIIIFFILDYFLKLLDFFCGSFTKSDPAVAVALFHTAFNLVGIIIFVPMLRQFSSLLSFAIPDKAESFTDNLDSNVAQVPAVAVESARRSCVKITLFIMDIFTESLKGKNVTEAELLDASQSLVKIRDFMGNVHLIQGVDYEKNRKISILHAIEHLGFLIDATKDDEARKDVIRHPNLTDLAASLSFEIENLRESLKNNDEKYDFRNLEIISEKMQSIRKNERNKILERLSSGSITPENAYSQIEALRWLDKITYRLWRTVHYLQGGAE